MSGCQSRDRTGSETGSTSVPVVRREDFSDRTYLLEIEHPMLSRAARPGQFVIVMSHPEGERIPLTIADFDREKGTVTLVIQAVGKTTRQMQSECVTGYELYSVAGPMGVPSRVHDSGKVVCVGGGLGVAPVFPQVRAFRQAGAYVIGVIGYRDASQVFWEERFSKWCNEFIVCTDDGSHGMKGLVTDGIELTLDRHPHVDELVAIGPPAMMRACAETTRPLGISTTVSLNPVMVDGTGMCGGCRVKLSDGMKFACVDGPEFDGHTVDFDDLVNRLNRFRVDESRAVDSWEKTRGANS